MFASGFNINTVNMKWRILSFVLFATIGSMPATAQENRLTEKEKIDGEGCATDMAGGRITATTAGLGISNNHRA
jgi:hypothetical protein